ncbi:MAG: hypothetical protein AB3N13_08605 [Arenibacterium sp.]
MFDPDTNSIEFHLKDLERQVKPCLRDYREPNRRSTNALRVISVIGLLVLAAPFVSWA